MSDRNQALKIIEITKYVEIKIQNSEEKKSKKLKCDTILCAEIKEMSDHEQTLFVVEILEDLGIPKVLCQIIDQYRRNMNSFIEDTANNGNTIHKIRTLVARNSLYNPVHDFYMADSKCWVKDYQKWADKNNSQWEKDFIPNHVRRIKQYYVDCLALGADEDDFYKMYRDSGCNEVLAWALEDDEYTFNAPPVDLDFEEHFIPTPLSLELPTPYGPDEDPDQYDSDVSTPNFGLVI